MLVVVDQALGDVQRGDVVALLLFGEEEDEFVAGAGLRVGGLAGDGFEALEQVVGGEGGVFAHADCGFAVPNHYSDVKSGINRTFLYLFICFAGRVYPRYWSRCLPAKYN